MLPLINATPLIQHMRQSFPQFEINRKQITKTDPQGKYHRTVVRYKEIIIYKSVPSIFNSTAAFGSLGGNCPTTQKAIVGQDPSVQE